MPEGRLSDRCGLARYRLQHAVTRRMAHDITAHVVSCVSVLAQRCVSDRRGLARYMGRWQEHDREVRIRDQRRGAGLATISPQSVHSQSTVSPQSAHSQPAVCQQSANSQPTVSRPAVSQQSVNSQSTVSQSVISQQSVNSQSAVSQSTVSS